MVSWTDTGRIRATLVLFALFALGLTSEATAQRQAEDRAKVVAAFLYKFLSFVEWPDTAFPTPSDPFRVVVLHDDEVEAAVADSVAGKEVKGRTIQVHRDAKEDALTSCHVLFIGEASESRLRDALSRLSGRAVLTVSLDERFAKRGGIIRLFEADRRLNIEVNLVAAQQANLEISSKLLAVAKVLREGDVSTQAEGEDHAEVAVPVGSEKVD